VALGAVDEAVALGVPLDGEEAAEHGPQDGVGLPGEGPPGRVEPMAPTVPTDLRRRGRRDEERWGEQMTQGGQGIMPRLLELCFSK